MAPRLVRVVPRALVGGLLLLAGLELALRAGGVVVELAQEYRNRQAGPGRVRILALGESMTADGAAPGARSWPRLLQTTLRRRGIDAVVVNEAVPGTTTSALLARLPEQLETVTPQIVVSMMGVNDGPRFWVKDAALFPWRGFVQSLRASR